MLTSHLISHDEDVSTMARKGEVPNGVGEDKDDQDANDDSNVGDGVDDGRRKAEVHEKEEVHHHHQHHHPGQHHPRNGNGERW